jgi:hypothetical protein
MTLHPAVVVERPANPARFKFCGHLYQTAFWRNHSYVTLQLMILSKDDFFYLLSKYTKLVSFYLPIFYYATIERLRMNRETRYTDVESASGCFNLTTHSKFKSA